MARYHAGELGQSLPPESDQFGTSEIQEMISDFFKFDQGRFDKVRVDPAPCDIIQYAAHQGGTVDAASVDFDALHVQL